VKRWPFALALVLMGGTWLLLASMSRAEVTPAREGFAGFPLALGEWRGKDLAMDAEVLDLLNLTDYVMRVYQRVSPEPVSAASLADPQAWAPVWLYVGYYGSQATGATYHSPKNCLPGGGWQFESMETATGVIPGRPEVAVNRVVIAKGLERQMIVYWYQDRGRVIASEYAAKVYLVWDSMTRNRTDGALVRISTPVVTDADAAFAHAVSFLEESWGPLARRLPE
jgi:EpsI family protein